MEWIFLSIVFIASMIYGILDSYFEYKKEETYYENKAKKEE